MVLLALSARLSADDVTEFTDKNNACTVKAGADWERMPGVEEKHKPTALCLRYTGKNEGKLVPNFMVIQVTSETTLDAVAEAFVAAARKKVPDQGAYGKIESARLDGEDARLVVTRTTVSDSPAIRKDIIARRNGTSYIAEFFCSDDQYESQVKPANALFDSFHWK